MSYRRFALNRDNASNILFPNIIKVKKAFELFNNFVYYKQSDINNLLMTVKSFARHRYKIKIQFIFTP